MRDRSKLGFTSVRQREMREKSIVFAHGLDKRLAFRKAMENLNEEQTALLEAAVTGAPKNWRQPDESLLKYIEEANTNRFVPVYFYVLDFDGTVVMAYHAFMNHQFDRLEYIDMNGVERMGMLGWMPMVFPEAPSEEEIEKRKSWHMESIDAQFGK